MTILFWSVFALVVAVWAAAEWIFARRVLDICRDGSRGRWIKARMVAVVAADVVLAVWFVFLGATTYLLWMSWPGFSLCHIAQMGIALFVIPLLGIMGGFVVGACAFCGMFGNLQEVQFGAIMLAAFLSSIYMFVAPFIHAWAVWRGKARSIWAMVFVFWVANWPLALLVPVMTG